ncbi:MAG: NCS2 family permease [Elusimicrobiota bacterium]
MIHSLISKSNIKTEIIGGITTFITMAYIIFVNPAILSSGGVDFEAVAVATCIGAGIMTIVMGLYSGYPYALAPGMGINAVVAFTLCAQMKLSYSVAMGIIVIEGIIVTILVLTRVRETVMNAIPKTIKLGIGVGIGLFIAFIGMSHGGIVVADPVTMVRLGKVTEPYVLVTVIGLIATAVLSSLRVKGGLLIGILITGLIGLLAGVVKPPREIISLPDNFTTLFNYDLSVVLNFALWPMIFALFMTDFFDTMGTIIGVGEEGGFLDENCLLPRLKNVLLVDSLSAVCGGVCGSSSVTTYIESAAGVAEGARTGIASLVTGVLFLLSLFLIPLVQVIGGGYEVLPGVYKYPVTAPALIVVGFLMMSTIKNIDFKKYEESIPAFLTIIGIPLTYNISHGIGFGFISYTLIKILTGQTRDIHPLLYVFSALFALNFAIS